MFDKKLYLVLVYLFVWVVGCFFFICWYFISLILRKIINFFQIQSINHSDVIFNICNQILFYYLFLRAIFFKDLFSLINITMAVIILIKKRIFFTNLWLLSLSGVFAFYVDNCLFSCSKKVHCLTLKIVLRACDKCPSNARFNTDLGWTIQWILLEKV